MRTRRLTTIAVIVLSVHSLACADIIKKSMGGDRKKVQSIVDSNRALQSSSRWDAADAKSKREAIARAQALCTQEKAKVTIDGKQEEVEPTKQQRSYSCQHARSMQARLYRDQLEKAPCAEVPKLALTYTEGADAKARVAFFKEHERLSGSYEKKFGVRERKCVAALRDAARVQTHAVKVVNRSGVALCSLQVGGEGKGRAKHFTTHTGEVAEGATVTLQVKGAPTYLVAGSCKNEIVHVGQASRSGVFTTFELRRDEKMNEARRRKRSAMDVMKVEGGVVVASAWPRSFADRMGVVYYWLQRDGTKGKRDRKLARTLGASIDKRAQVLGGKYTVKSSMIISKDWNIFRNKRTGRIVMRKIITALGMQRKDGSCDIHAYQLRQRHDGRSFSGSIVYDGVPQGAGLIYVPCAMIDWLGKRPNGTMVK